MFIFATTELHKVPATIKSRCQQFNFRQIPVETIQGVLRDACAEMKIDAEEEALFWIAKEATGSLRDAYTLFDQVLSFSGDKLRSDLIREKLGITGLDKLNELGEAAVRGDPAGAFALIEGILGGGIALEQFILDLVSYYHSLLFIKAGVIPRTGFPPRCSGPWIRPGWSTPRTCFLSSTGISATPFPPGSSWKPWFPSFAGWIAGSLPGNCGGPSPGPGRPWGFPRRKAGRLEIRGGPPGGRKGGLAAL